jgi:hypothetical protein
MEGDEIILRMPQTRAHHLLQSERNVALVLELPSLVLHVLKSTTKVVVYSTMRRDAEGAAAQHMHAVGDLAESSQELHG